MPYYTTLDSEESSCPVCKNPNTIFLLMDKVKKHYKCHCGQETIFKKIENGSVSFKEVK